MFSSHVNLPWSTCHAVKGKKKVSLSCTAPSHPSPCLPSVLMNITASSCATGAVGFSLDFSQVIIQVRICHPQNERKMNLQSQMQIYLLKKKRVEGQGEREMRKGREKQGEEGYVQQREETMNRVSKNKYRKETQRKEGSEEHEEPEVRRLRQSN